MDLETKKEFRRINKKLARYNDLLDIHIKRTEANEKWIAKHDGAHSGRFALIKEAGILLGIGSTMLGIGIVIAKLFGWM